MTKKTILITLLLSAFLSGCASRSSPIPKLGQDFFGESLPNNKRTFVNVNKPAPKLEDVKFVYLNIVYPPHVNDKDRSIYTETAKDALYKIGFKNIYFTNDIITKLKSHGTKFDFYRPANNDELSYLQQKEGNYLILNVQYISMRSVGYRLTAIQPSNHDVIFDGSYDTIIWSNVPKELIYPSFNLLGNWVHHSLEI